MSQINYWMLSAEQYLHLIYYFESYNSTVCVETTKQLAFFQLTIF